MTGTQPLNFEGKAWRDEKVYMTQYLDNMRVHNPLILKA